MRRAIIGFGTPLGYYLASGRTFLDCYTYKQALSGISHCDEAVIIVPSSRRLCGNTLGLQGQKLIAAASQTALRIVVLSSIDVYSSKGIPFDETAKPCGSAARSWLPSFEHEVLQCGVPSQILRLPDVFGPYIAKGTSSCFLDGDASRLNRVAIHQLYPLHRLECDIAAARNIGAPIINLVPEPLPMKTVLAEHFPGQIGQVLTPAPYSRIRTRYAEKFGGTGGYIMSAAEVLKEIGRHVREIRDLPASARRGLAGSAGQASAGALA
ncbi:MAG: hypothetical protein ACLP7P_17115 [Rhodomicrobium sp.]